MKRPLIRCLLLALLCLFFWQTSSFARPSAASPDNGPGKPVPAPLFRKFETLSPSFGLSPSDPIIVDDHAVADTVLDQRHHAQALLEKVLAEQRFLESLDALSEIELPVGVVKAGGAVDYSILIDRMQFSREGALMDVYVSLALPQTNARIAFHGAVPLSAQGGIAGSAKVYLIGDHVIKFNNNTLLTIKGTDQSYVEFDCGGFVGVNLDAELEFSSDVILPENERGEPQAGRVHVPFTTYTQSLNDIIVTVSLPPFQVKGLRGFGFSAARAYLDWSDLSNPPGIAFPPEYTSPVLEAGLPQLWQGLYLTDVKVELPEGFGRRNSTTRVSAGLQQAIFDDQGFTGSVYAENLIPDGDMNGWKYTLDKMSLRLSANHVEAFSLEGNLAIPVVKAKDGTSAEFGYIAGIDAEGGYTFSVTVGENDLKLDLWAADLRLMKGSRVVVREEDNKFYPSAILSGELGIHLFGKGPKGNLTGIRFEGMAINSKAPYFVPGTFGFGREGTSSTISKYPVVFDNITLKSEDTRAGIAFDLMINIDGKPEDESFAGKAGLIVWGQQDDEPKKDLAGHVISLDRYSWAFEKVELTDVKISIEKPKIIELAGAVRFFDDDETYGDGFKGSLKGTIQSIKVQAEALFGRTDTFRYWYADALVELKTGVPIVPGVLSAYGFGGGYYSKMKQSEKPIETTLGESPSGITYVPDENTIGIRAIVLIGTPRREAMNGDVALEVSINRHGGINSVTFTGNANFMSLATLTGGQIKQMASAAVAGNLTEKLGSLSRGQVYGSVKLFFDNVNDVFHGNLEVYVNVAGGIVRGVSDNNKAGWAVLHFEKHNWYVFIGTPDQPIGLEVARIFKSKSYFMMGKDLPGSPPPPEQVTEILGNVDLDYMRDMNALESGMGIAFGLHFLVDTGDLRFLMFYGRFSAGTGLDFMLKDYGNEYHCAGLSGPIGINGWYANGQAYAFVMGKIGIKVNLKFYKGTYDILSIGAAAILQAKGPNPFWMRGTVGGYYKILGGLVKGKCRFEVTVGKDCKPVGEENLLEDVSMIAGITPASSSRDVNVFNTPQVAFNIPVGEIFEITDMEQKIHSFRAMLDLFEVTDGYRRIDGQLQWNDENDVVVFNAKDLLPGNRKLKARARLSFEEKINGVWTKVKMDGKVVSETAESDFETGEAPATIPESNVVLSYPLPNQRNFYPREFDQGFIQLAEGQAYLFHPGDEWIQKIRMTETASGQYLESSLTYNAAAHRVTFAIPAGFQNAKVYRFEIVNLPRQTSVIDQNVATVSRAIDIDESAGSATLTTHRLDGALNMLEAKSIYSSLFRTSKYNTFAEKMKNVAGENTVRLATGVNIFQLTTSLSGDEGFDEAELAGYNGYDRLIRMEAVLDGNKWYQRYVYPLVYEGYPLLGWMKINRRDPDVLGVPPVKDIYFRDFTTGEPAMTEATTTRPFGSEKLVYNLGQSVASDFFDVQRHAVNFIADYPGRATPRLEALLLQPLPHIRHGTYRIRFNYVIPGLDRTTSAYEIEINNRIPDND